MLKSPEYELEFALRVARRQGRTMIRAFKRGTGSDTKEDGTVVTVADITISEDVVRMYSERGVRVISEEGGTGEYGDPHAMILDPIDGTLDFVDGQQRVPRRSQAMFSLGMNRRVPVMGVAYAPLIAKPRLYGAVSGGAAVKYEAGRRKVTLSVARSARTGTVLVSRGQWGTKIARNLERMGFRALTLRSAVFKAVAVADSDLVRAFDRNLLAEDERVVGFVSTGTHLHDYAASSVIVGAAGGITTGLDNGPLSQQAGRQGCAMSANEHIHWRLLEAAQI